VDRFQDINDVVVRLDKADAVILLQVVVSMLRHPSTSDAGRSALLALACQVRSATRAKPA
jgi:hypothetical protein